MMSKSGVICFTKARQKPANDASIFASRTDMSAVVPTIKYAKNWKRINSHRLTVKMRIRRNTRVGHQDHYLPTSSSMVLHSKQTGHILKAVFKRCCYPPYQHNGTYPSGTSMKHRMLWWLSPLRLSLHRWNREENEWQNLRTLWVSLRTYKKWSLTQSPQVPWGLPIYLLISDKESLKRRKQTPTFATKLIVSLKIIFKEIIRPW